MKLNKHIVRISLGCDGRTHGNVTQHAFICSQFSSRLLQVAGRTSVAGQKRAVSWRIVCSQRARITATNIFVHTLN